MYATGGGNVDVTVTKQSVPADDGRPASDERAELALLAQAHPATADAALLQPDYCARDVRDV
jgi:hypothetical protein